MSDIVKKTIYVPNEHKIHITLSSGETVVEDFYIEDDMDSISNILLRYKYGNLNLQEAYSEMLKCVIVGYKL